MCASTRCPFSSSTRNIASGNGSSTRPSTSMAPSFLPMSSAIRSTSLGRGHAHPRTNQLLRRRVEHAQPNQHLLGSRRAQMPFIRCRLDACSTKPTRPARRRSTVRRSGVGSNSPECGIRGPHRRQSGRSRYRCRIMSLTCPKCQGKMRSSERSGVTVEQCKQCRGVFLDHGELEHLITAEARFLGVEPRDAQEVESPRIPDYDAPRRPVSDERKRSERLFGEDRKSRGKSKKRKKTFLEEFFD